MGLRLSARDQELLDGKGGLAARLAMRVVARMAQIQGAAELMDVSGAHIDGSIYQGDASLEFAETLARWGGKVVIPTSLNIGSLDELRQALDEQNLSPRNSLVFIDSLSVLIDQFSLPSTSWFLTQVGQTRN